MRVIEAWITVTLADGTTRCEPRRHLTSLLDHERYPSGELMELYHRRWQVETTYFSIKATMLDGRVLRWHSVPGLDQEAYALLATYQALIRAAADAMTARPGLVMERISFTVLLQAAADQVTTATGIHTAEPDTLARTDRPNRPGQPPARRATPARQGPQPQEPHGQVRAERGKTPANNPDLPSPPRSTSWKPALHPAPAAQRNGVGVLLSSNSGCRSR
ncbi:transposase [Streptomyces sp. NPDC015125]|uniref:transposase n=1 Tax=Streptomyces sp. NPDC015125 TaxID=3364938 RepID=UPI0036F6C996